MLELPPPKVVRLAARLGYDFVGVRLLSNEAGGPAYLQNDPAMLRETQAALAETGVGVLDVEVVRLAPENSYKDFESLLHLAASLSARSVLVVSGYASQAPFADAFGRFSELAQDYGLMTDLEFMSWTGVQDLPGAVRMLNEIDQPNAGILVDPLHFVRTGSRIEELRRLPRHWFHYAQICDAPKQRPRTLADMMQFARTDRLFPGEGELDLVEIMGALPSNLPIAVETPNASLGLSPEERALRGLAGARSVMARTDRARIAQDVSGHSARGAMGK